MKQELFLLVLLVIFRFCAYFFHIYVTCSLFQHEISDFNSFEWYIKMNLRQIQYSLITFKFSLFYDNQL